MTYPETVRKVNAHTYACTNLHMEKEIAIYPLLLLVRRGGGGVWHNDAGKFLGVVAFTRCFCLLSHWP